MVIGVARIHYNENAQVVGALLLALILLIG